MELLRFGLNNYHAPFLTGCSYTPSLQSSKKQSLGPLTVLINLVMNTEEKYLKAWKDAFCQTFKLIPNIEEIANLLAGSRSKYSALIRQMGDLCHFGITRSSNKEFIPVTMLMCVNMAENVLFRTRFESDLGSFVFRLNADALYVALQNLGFSEHGLLYFWNRAALEVFTTRGDPEVMTRETVAQISNNATP